MFPARGTTLVTLCFAHRRTFLLADPDFGSHRYLRFLHTYYAVTADRCDAPRRSRSTIWPTHWTWSGHCLELIGISVAAGRHVTAEDVPPHTLQPPWPLWRPHGRERRHRHYAGECGHSIGGQRLLWQGWGALVEQDEAWIVWATFRKHPERDRRASASSSMMREYTCGSHDILM